MTCRRYVLYGAIAAALLAGCASIPETRFYTLSEASASPDAGNPGLPPSSGSIFKSIIIMKEDIAAKMKDISPPVIRYLPAFCQRRNNVQIVVHLDQRVVQLVHCPHNGLVFGKCRVE